MARPIHKRPEEAGARTLPERPVDFEAPTAEELSKRWRVNAGGVGVLAVLAAIGLKLLKLGLLFHFVGLVGWGWGGLALAGLVLAGIAIERIVSRRRAGTAARRGGLAGEK
jgi:hypothetical protein